MPRAKVNKVNLAQLREAFKTDLAACWRYARALHPKEAPYAFALHGLEGTPHLYPYVLTEQGLTKVAGRYVAEGYHETIKEARKELRYSMEDSPYAGELEAQLPSVDALMEPIEDTLDETEGYALLAKAAMDAFISLDKEGVFGRGMQRGKLLLLVETGLAEKDWSKPSAKRLNSAEAFRRYEAETKIEGVYASSDSLAISPDGRLLYFAGSRATSSGKDPTINETVACDILGLRLKRRWEISTRSRFGESPPQIACSADGTLFLKWAKYFRETCTTIVGRIPRGNKAELRKTQMPGEPAEFAVSADGRRVAVLTHDKTLCLINDKLEIARTHKLKTMLRGLTWLRSGDLLGITNQGVVRISADLRMTPTRYRKEAFMLSLDAKEKLCAISMWPEDSLICDQKPRDQFGFQLFSFPEFKLIRTLRIPAHQLIRATLSQDGKLVACRASECGKYTSFIVVYEVASGREVGRKKSDSYEMAFLPDRDVLALTASGHLKGEPVVLWRFR
jgi:hypothetical protein